MNVDGPRSAPSEQPPGPGDSLPHDRAIPVSFNSDSLDQGYAQLAQQRDASNRPATRRRRPAWADEDPGSESNEGDAETAALPASDGLAVPIAPVRVDRSSALGILASLLPWMVVVHVLRGMLGGESGWTVAVVTALALALWALMYARPARMVGKSGEVRFSTDGMHVTFDALMDDVWFVPIEHIGDVRCANKLPHLSERRALGLTGRDANVLVRFKEPSPRVPVRGGFFVPAMVGGNRGKGVMPVPNTTVDQICWRVDTGDLDGLQRRIESALKGEADAPAPTYVAGRSDVSRETSAAISGVDASSLRRATS